MFLSHFFGRLLLSKDLFLNMLFGVLAFFVVACGKAKKNDPVPVPPSESELLTQLQSKQQQIIQFLDTYQSCQTDSDCQVLTVGEYIPASDINSLQWCHNNQVHQDAVPLSGWIDEYKKLFAQYKTLYCRTHTCQSTQEELRILNLPPIGSTIFYPAFAQCENKTCQLRKGQALIPQAEFLGDYCFQSLHAAQALPIVAKSVGQLTLKLSGTSQGGMTGKVDCNSFFGDYTIGTLMHIQFAQVSKTEAKCLVDVSFEPYFEKLLHAWRYRFSADSQRSLIITTEEGEELYFKRGACL